MDSTPAVTGLRTGRRAPTDCRFLFFSVVVGVLTACSGGGGPTPCEAAGAVLTEVDSVANATGNGTSVSDESLDELLAAWSEFEGKAAGKLEVGPVNSVLDELEQAEPDERSPLVDELVHERDELQDVMEKQFPGCAL